MAIEQTCSFAGSVLLVSSWLFGASAVSAADSKSASAGEFDLLRLKPAEQLVVYPNIENYAQVRTVSRGTDEPSAIPVGDSISVAYQIDGASIDTDRFIEDHHVAGLLVLHNGSIRLERYGLSLTASGRWPSFSIAKSVTATLFGAALKDGSIKSLDDSLSQYIKELEGSEYARVTIRQLLTMTSGVKWSETYWNPFSDVAQIKKQPAIDGVDPIVAYMRKLPRAAEPGAKWNYSTGETDLAGVVLERATGKSLAAYLSEKIWKPLRMEQDAIWMTHPQGSERGGCCLSIALRDYGRFGQFVLNGGHINGEPILAGGWSEQATRNQRPDGDNYGYFWWMNNDGSFAAEGIFGQLLYIHPKEQLVIVVLSAWPNAEGGKHGGARWRYIQAVRKALQSEEQ